MEQSKVLKIGRYTFTVLSQKERKSRKSVQWTSTVEMPTIILTAGANEVKAEGVVVKTMLGKADSE